MKIENLESLESLETNCQAFQAFQVFDPAFRSIIEECKEYKQGRIKHVYTKRYHVFVIIQ